MFSAFCFLATAGILFYIVKFRVHVHIHATYTPTTSRRVASPARKRPVASDSATGLEASNQAIARPRATGTYSQVDPNVPAALTAHVRVLDPAVQHLRDIESALVNLGAKHGRARATAAQVVREYPDATLDVQLSVALQTVGAA